MTVPYNPSGPDSNLDPDIANSLAHNFEQKIKRVDMHNPSFKTRFTFKDDSQLLVEPSNPPNLKPTGTKYSISSRFASSVQDVTVEAGVFEIVFLDGSKLSYSNEPPSHSAR